MRTKCPPKAPMLAPPGGLVCALKTSHIGSPRVGRLKEKDVRKRGMAKKGKSAARRRRQAQKRKEGREGIKRRGGRIKNVLADQ